MADLLARTDIDTALESLAGWSHDGKALVRRAEVPGDSQDALVEAVATVADAMDHHPELEREADAVTFRLWTHSAGGVTAKDIELAARIDQTLSGSGSDQGTA
ncbi:MAG: 4a-hydroxytetrahydrobiopterin dehydratase [Nocardioides sp.]